MSTGSPLFSGRGSARQCRRRVPGIRSLMTKTTQIVVKLDADMPGIAQKMTQMANDAYEKGYEDGERSGYADWIQACRDAGADVSTPSELISLIEHLCDQSQ